VRWFSASNSTPAPDQSRAHRSPALKALLDGLRPETRPTVLDLGPPVAGNVAFLTALSCRVRIADLLRALRAEPLESRKPEAVGALIDRLLPLAPGECFDAMLAWDVFDYLRPDHVSALMARLTPACRPGARVLVLTSMRRQLPAAPLRYRILGRESLAGEGPLEPAGRPAGDGRTRVQPDVRRLMPGFSVRHSVLLRSGVQEYLLVRDAGKAPNGTGVSAAPRSTWFRRGSL